MRVLLLIQSILAVALAASQASAKKPCVTLTIVPDLPQAQTQSSVPQSPPIQDGRLVTAVIKLDDSYASNPPTEVELSAPGIRFGRTKFKFNKRNKNSFQQVVTCRSESGSAPDKDGTIVDVPVTFTYKNGPVAQEVQNIPRQVVSSGSCSGWGDPHLTTLDGVAYDFQTAGVFRLVQANNFQVQVFQEKCGPVATLQDRAPSCYQGVAIAFGPSVARFFIVNGAIQVAKGSPSLQWLSVEKLANTDGYRVFVNVDQATYIDINVGTLEAYNNYPFLNVALQLSAYFKTNAITGLMGNWNGDKTDDLTNNDQLAKLHGQSLSTNLFTCVNDACLPMLKPTTWVDANALGLPINQNLTHQGYTVVSANRIPLQAFKPTLKTFSRQLDEATVHAAGSNNGIDGNATTMLSAVDDANLTTRATQLCTQVIAGISTCVKYVRGSDVFVTKVCVADAVMLQDLSLVDSAKLTYLRECRRELDARLEANVTTTSETTTLRNDRAMLMFGDISQCRQNCSGRGECLAAGCKCQSGFTGLGCDLPY